MDGGSLDQYAPISENVLSKITVAVRCCIPKANILQICSDS